MVLVREGRPVRDVRKHAGADFERVTFEDAATGTRCFAVYRRPGATVSSRLLEVLGDELQQAPRSIVLGDLSLGWRRRGAQPRQLRLLLEMYGLRK